MVPGGGGAVLVIRDHPTPDFVGYPDPDEVFRVEIQPGSLTPIYTGLIHPPDFPLLPTVSDPAGIHVVPERTSSDVVPNNTGDP